MYSATAKSKFSIGTSLNSNIGFADLELSDFTGDNYIEVDPVTDLGEIGGNAAILEAKFINSGTVGRRKGTIDNGQIELKVARDTSDPGQLALVAAISSNLAFNFKVELTDAPAGGTNSMFYFRGVVGGKKTSLGEADNIITDTYTVGIDGPLFEVPAAVAAGP